MLHTVTHSFLFSYPQTQHQFPLMSNGINSQALFDFRSAAAVNVSVSSTHYNHSSSQNSPYISSSLTNDWAASSPTDEISSRQRDDDEDDYEECSASLSTSGDRISKLSSTSTMQSSGHTNETTTYSDADKSYKYVSCSSTTFITALPRHSLPHWYCYRLRKCVLLRTMMQLP